MMMDLQAARYTISGEIPQQEGNNHPTNTPTGVFPTSDGVINIQASAEHLFKRMCDTLGAPEIYENSDYSSNEKRTALRDQINAEISKYTKKRSTAHWVEAFAEAGVPCGPILDMGEVFKDPQVHARDMVQTIHHPTIGNIQLVGPAVKYSETPAEIRLPPPLLGQHTDEVLNSIVGLEQGVIDSLRTSGVL
mgnify:CR=1 FL=1